MPDEIRRTENTVSTPEGDNEFAPDQPLDHSTVEADVDGLQQWPSNSAMEEDKKDPAPEELPDHKPQHHSGLRYVLDEIVSGKIQP